MLKKKPAWMFGDGRVSTCKCGRGMVLSPMNSKVRLCDGCLNQKDNCQCPMLPRSETHHESSEPSDLA